MTWYDRIYDPAHVLYDLSYSQSTDGGVTWSVPQRVTDQSSNPNGVIDVKLVDELGFRKSLVFGLDYLIAGWLDTRLGQQQGDFFVDRGTFPAITPTPTFTLTLTPTNTATATPTSCPIQFTDVPDGSPFYTFVRCLACGGIISGYPDGTFRPANPVTRGQISKIVSNAAGLTDPPGAQLFEDVAIGSTFYDFIQRLANLEVMSGYPCGNPEPCVPPGNRPYFRPNAGATRGQVSKIVANTFFPGCDPHFQAKP
jgi:hypothetical protein